GPHRRAGALLPDGRPHRPRAIPWHRRAHRGRRRRHREGNAEPVRRHPERGSGRRKLDGEGVEIAREADPRLTPGEGRRYGPRLDEEVHFPDAADDANAGHAHAWPGRASRCRGVLSLVLLTDLLSRTIRGVRPGPTGDGGLLARGRSTSLSPAPETR